MSTIQKAAVAGLTGIIGLGLGLALGVTGANAAAQHSPDKRSSNSATERDQHKQGMQKKLAERQPATKGHDKRELKEGHKAQQDKPANTKDAQPREPKSTPPSNTPDAIPTPTK